MLDTATVDPKNRTGGFNSGNGAISARPGHANACASLGIRPWGLKIAPRKTLYEQYHPYRTSAYRAQDGTLGVSAKRYRYNGKERDDETKLYYYGARYYAPWLGRWTAADPLAFADGVGAYTYVRGSPVVLSDPNGKESWWDDEPTKPEQLPARTAREDLSELFRMTIEGSESEDISVSSRMSVAPEPVKADDERALAPRTGYTAGPFGFSPEHSRIAPDPPYCPSGACHQPGRLTVATEPDTSRAHQVMFPLYGAAAILALPTLSSGTALLGATATLPFTLEGHDEEDDYNFGPAVMVLSLGIGGAAVELGQARRLVAAVEEEAAPYERHSRLGNEGQCCLGVLDTKTGTIFFGRNTGVPTDIHPVLAKRLESLLAETGGAGIAKGVPGEHAELVALNEALFAKQAAGETVTEATLSDFLIYNERLRGAASGQFIPRCDNCAYLTEGARVVQ